MKIFVSVEIEAGDTVEVATVFGTAEQIIPIVVEMLKAAGLPREELTSILDDESLPEKVVIEL